MTSITRQQFTSGSVRLSYLDIAPESQGPALLFLHGLTANAHCLDGLTSHPLLRDYRRFALDLRGRGQSQAPLTGYTLSEHCQDVLAWLDHVGLRRAHLVGHSFGALLSVYLAVHHPDRVERLVLLDISQNTPHSERVMKCLEPSLARLDQVLASPQEYLAKLRSAPHLQQGWDPQMESYLQADCQSLPDGRARLVVRAATIQAVIQGMQAQDWPSLFALVQQRSLLIHAKGGFGSESAAPFVDTEDAQSTALHLKAEWLQVDGNHLTMLYGASANRIAQAMVTFLAR